MNIARISPTKIESQNYYNRNKTQTNSNVSFQGLGEGNFAQKLATSDRVKKVLISSNKNTLAIEAAYALLITCGLRPIITLLTPAKNEDEKDKNKFRAAHAFASGLLGYIFTIGLAHPISDGVEKIMHKQSPDGSLKYMKKYTDQLKVRDGNVFKELAKRIHQPVFLPLRAMATVALVPPILSLFGIEKDSDEKSSQEKETKQMPEQIPEKNVPPVFKSLEGGKTNEN